MHPHLLPCALLLLAAGPLAAQNKVWIVAPGGAFDPPTDPQPIIDGASDGDILLFKSGGYPPAVIDGKSLTLVEDTGATAVLARLVVRDLLPGQVVLVSGVGVRSQADSPQPLVELLHDDGAILMRDVTISDEFGTLLGGEPDVALRIQDCASVTLLDGLVAGRRNDEPFGSDKGASAPALELDGAELAILGGQLLGADGLNALDTFTQQQPATPGERAVVLQAGTLLLSGTVVRGGHGGNGGADFFGTCLDPAPGGHGLDASSGSPAIVVHDSLVEGGPGGAGTLACPDSAPDGLPISPASEPKEDLAGAHLPLLATPVAREGETLSVLLTGPPGALAALFVATEPLFLLASAKSGALLVAPLLLVLPDVVPASGVLTILADVPPLPAGLQGLPVLLQGAFSLPTGVLLGDATLILLLDASI